MLADQESIEAGMAQAKQIVMRAQAGLADRDTMVGNLIDQLEGSFGTDGQSLQVAIVHPQDAGVRGERAIQFRPGVNLDERLHTKLSAERDEFMQLRISKRSNNQEKTVGVVSTRFPNLPGIEDEILAKNRKSYGLACFAEIL